jgi:hypothetical protein
MNTGVGRISGPMKSIIPFIAALAAGCSVDAVTTSTATDNLTAQNKLATNKLATNKLATNKLATNKLATNSLGASDLMATPDGREVMSYVIGCALDTSQTFVGYDGDGNQYSFPGWLGLATAWADRVPTADERQLVTSCLLSRTNFFGVSVQLSLRGDSPLLTTDADEIAAYPADEAAFWGDLFDPSGTQTEFACESAAKVADESNTSYALRQCATPSGDGVTTKCGFTYQGTCGAQVPASGVHVWLH